MWEENLRSKKKEKDDDGSGNEEERYVKKKEKIDKGERLCSIDDDDEDCIDRDKKDETKSEEIVMEIGKNKKKNDYRNENEDGNFKYRVTSHIPRHKQKTRIYYPNQAQKSNYNYNYENILNKQTNVYNNENLYNYPNGQNNHQQDKDSSHNSLNARFNTNIALITGIVVSMIVLLLLLLLTLIKFKNHYNRNTTNLKLGQNTYVPYNDNKVAAGFCEGSNIYTNTAAHPKGTMVQSKIVDITDTSTNNTRKKDVKEWYV